MIDLHQPEWLLPEGVHAYYSGRRGGVSLAPYNGFNLGDHVGDLSESVAANRAALLDALPGVSGIQWLKQVHGVEVFQATADSLRIIPEADAAATTEAGVACAVMTADCLPVLFCDQSGDKIAAAHAGWRGLASGVLLNTLKEFSDASQVSAYLCPAIGFEAFEVGPEVKGAFPDAPETCFRNGEGDRWYADLFELARWQLIRAGIGSVHGGGICTFEDESGYFSYRRDGVTGRQVSLIWKASNLPRFQTG